MRVFDEIRKCWIDEFYATRIIVSVSKSCICFGYTNSSTDLVLAQAYTSQGKRIVEKVHLETFKGGLEFDNSCGLYICTDTYRLPINKYIQGNGGFPYTFKRRYEAIENFDKFLNKQVVLDKKTKYTLSEYLDFSIGLEFETSRGYVPENLCFRDGLIPLRDGSISGLEYSTVVLRKNKGISLLNQELNTLKRYTSFDKECSLHIHFGGYPMVATKVFNLYLVCKRLEKEISSLVPAYTFHSSKYKANQKDYCKKLPVFDTFKEMYSHLVGMEFTGKFTLPHPDDIERDQKWHIKTRYYWCNFINLLCYKVNKTVEFRLLRPTYNFKKILLWIYIFNAILKYSKEYYNGNLFTLNSIIETCYPKELSDKIIDGIDRLKAISANQYSEYDFIGANAWMDDYLLDSLEI